MQGDEMSLQAENVQTVQPTISIRNEYGQEYWLNMVDGKLETGGDLPMTEAAEVFFKQIKRIGDEYASNNTLKEGK